MQEGVIMFPGLALPGCSFSQLFLLTHEESERLSPLLQLTQLVVQSWDLTTEPVSAGSREQRTCREPSLCPLGGEHS